jgi:hypothetical protein
MQPNPYRLPYRLKVQQVEQVCLFELTWGQGQQVSAQLPYPVALITAYQNWQRLYLTFYKAVQLPPLPIAEEKTALRGRVLNSGDLASATVNWHAQLVQAEAKLLADFYYWLQSPELYEIRKTIAHASQQLLDAQASLDLFLTCSPMELARLPWEEWEIGTDFALGKAVRIVRTPANIRSETASHHRRGRTRVLAILGDDTGLNFQADRQAVQSLTRIADVQFVGWQPGKTEEQVKQEVCEALVDEDGWDVLFFAGHSNESQMTGGELSIAPKVSVSINEIAPRLATARARGLQFALFNSCSGLQIAESLIDLGFSQVAVMREPIHNRVAQEFLVTFMNQLAQRKNVHNALQSAYQILKLEKNITYPSAYLVPSLFCHPGANLFQIPRLDWKQWLRHWSPKRYEAVAVGVGCLLALLPVTQSYLLERRVLVQAAYRDWTNQLPAAGMPPVALVLIDDASTREDERLTDPSPIDRSYLADVIRKLSAKGAKVVGVDYLLDRQAGKETQLRQALQQGVKQHTWFVFGTLYDPFEANRVFTLEQPGIAQPEWTLQAYVTMWPDRVTLPFPGEDCRQTCPFAYLLSLIQTAQQEVDRLLVPQLNSQTDLRTQLIDAIQQTPITGESLAFLQQAHLGWVSAFTSEVLRLSSWEPIIDFSIPPDRIYQGMAAWRILEDETLDLSRLDQQVVIIGAGDYVDAGNVEKGVLDLFPVPPAVTYWRNRLPEDNQAAFATRTSKHPYLYQRFYAGAEAHAYMVHHLLNQHLITPIPTIWVMGLAVLLGRGTVLLVRRRQEQTRWSARHQQTLTWTLLGATVAYGVISLQLYITASIIFPWFLPSAMFWVYVFPILKRRKSRV